MLDKILKMFFVKTKELQDGKTITIRRRPDGLVNEIKDKRQTSVKNVETCLSSYFVSRRGLNLIERGFTYSFQKNSHNR